MAGLDFDLIVLDVMMPTRMGETLCRAIRAERPVPILLLTAKAETADRIAGLEAGADDLSAKPFEPKELLLRSTRSCGGCPQGPRRAPPARALILGPNRYDVDRAS